MRTISLIAALLAGPQAAAPDPDPKIAVTLADGSQFLAPPGTEALTVKTEYGEQRIPLKEVRSLRRVSDADFMIQTAKLTMTGEVARREFEFQSEIGRVRIPLAELRAISATAGLSLLADANTLAAWTFGDLRGGTSYDLVKGRALELHGMEPGVDKDGVGAIVRKGENSYAEAKEVDDLDFDSGDFTIEARFIAGPSTRGYSAVLSKNDGTTGQVCDFSVFTQAGGIVHFQSVTPRGTVSVNTPAPVIKPAEWSYVAIVIQPQVPQITFYANGKPVHQIRQAAFCTDRGTVLYVGTSPPYQASFSCAERVQFVRLSKGARRAEEIAEMQGALGSGGGLAGSATAKGVLLRGGGFVRAGFPSIGGARFKTKYGVLALGEGTTGQVSIYRFREEEMPRIREEAGALVRQLGAGKVEEREEAQGKLLKIGEPAIPLLREGLKDADSEVRQRAAAVLKKFDGSGVSSRPVGDVYRAGQTVLHGWLELAALEVATKFGTFHPPIQRIDRINLGDRPVKGKPVLKLKSGEAVQGDAAKESAIALDTGFGTLSIPLVEVAGLTYDAARELWTVRTERLSASGKLGREEVRVDTPAGPILLPLSEVVEITIP